MARSKRPALRTANRADSRSKTEGAERTSAELGAVWSKGMKSFQVVACRTCASGQTRTDARVRVDGRS